MVARQSLLPTKLLLKLETEINQIVFATASIITEQIAPKPKKRKAGRRDTLTWKAKLEKEITRKWSDLSILTEIEKGSNIKGRKRDQIKKCSNIKIQAKAQRIRRFEKRNKHFLQSKIFKEDAKNLYRELAKEILMWMNRQHLMKLNSAGVKSGKTTNP